VKTFLLMTYTTALVAEHLLRHVPLNSPRARQPIAATLLSLVSALSYRYTLGPPDRADQRGIAADKPSTDHRLRPLLHLVVAPAGPISCSSHFCQDDLGAPSIFVSVVLI
jgi:hypothetical protein